MHDVFISYNRDDAPIASRIADRLEQDGLSIFYDRDVLVAGQPWTKKIAQELEETRAVVVLLSGKYGRSRWVEDELTQALEGDKLVVPVLLDEGAKNNWVWPLVANRQAIKLDENSQNSDAAIDRLVQYVRQALHPVKSPSPSRFAHRPYFWTLIVSIISAVMGGLLVWLLR